MKKERKDRVALVLALLVNSNADIHLKTSRGATPLHLAVEVRGIIECRIGKYGPQDIIVLWITILYIQHRKVPRCVLLVLLHFCYYLILAVSSYSHMLLTFHLLLKLLQ